MTVFHHHRFHENPLVDQKCRDVLAGWMEVLLAQVPAQDIVAVLLTGSWSLGGGCARVRAGAVQLLSDFDLLVVVTDALGQDPSRKAKQSVDRAWRDAACGRRHEAQVDFGIEQQSKLPERARTLFWQDCCAHAVLLWGESNPLHGIDMSDRLSVSEGVDLLTNRALGQLFVLPQLVIKKNDPAKVLFHCSKVAIDGLRALAIIDGSYGYTNETQGCLETLLFDTATRHRLPEIGASARFWIEQKMDYDEQRVMDVCSDSAVRHRGSKQLSVWVRAANEFRQIWQKALTALDRKGDMIAATELLLVKNKYPGYKSTLVPWLQLCRSGSVRHAALFKILLIAATAHPAEAARFCGTVSLCHQPWGSAASLAAGVESMRRYLPFFTNRAATPTDQWADAVDSAVSIWRVHVNGYNDSWTTSGETIRQMFAHTQEKHCDNGNCGI